METTKTESKNVEPFASIQRISRSGRSRHLNSRMMLQATLTALLMLTTILATCVCGIKKKPSDTKVGANFDTTHSHLLLESKTSNGRRERRAEAIDNRDVLYRGFKGVLSKIFSKSAYGKNKADKVNDVLSNVVINVLKFTSNLQSVQHQAKACQSLINAMALLGLNNSLQIFLIDAYVDQLVQVNSTDRNLTTFESIRSQLEKAKIDVVNNLEIKVRAGDDREIVRFAAKSDDILLEHLVEIVTRIYEVPDGDYWQRLQENVKEILQFTSNLPLAKQKAQCYQALIDAMNKSSHLDSPAVLVIENHLKSFLSTSDASAVELHQVKLALETAKPKAMAYLALQIQKDHDNQKLYQFARNYRMAIHANLPELVRETYVHNEQNAISIMKFANEFTHLDEILLAYTVLYDEIIAARMMTFNLIFRIAHRMDEETRRSSKFTADSAQVRQMQFNIWQKFPRAIQAMLSSEDVCITNAAFTPEYYLFVKRNLDEYRAFVSTTQEPKDPTALSYKWVFEPEESRDDPTSYVSFKIKVDSPRNLFYTSREVFADDHKKGRVYTWRETSDSYFIGDGRWEVQNENWQESRYYLYNKHGYLNADEVEGANLWRLPEPGQRRAFTWRGEGKGPHPVWKISPC